MDIYEMILRHVIDEFKDELAVSLEGVTQSGGAIRFHYSEKECAYRLANNIPEVFDATATVIDDLAIGIYTVLILPTEEYHENI